jgi:hypothetical protein
MLPPAIRPGGRRICITVFAIVVFPQPDSPASPEHLALANRKVDAVDCSAPLVAAAVLDDELSHLEQVRVPRAGHERLLHEARHAPSSRTASRPPKSIRSHRARLLLGAQARVRELVDPGEQQHEPEHGERERGAGKKNGHHSPWSTVEFVCAQ